MAASNSHPLHIIFFPLMSPGHMLPMADLALLLATRGARGTIITTPSNAATFRPTLSRSTTTTLDLLLIPFPSPSTTGLHPGNENLSSTPPAHFGLFVAALPLLQPPLAALLRSLRPDCLVSDVLFPWTTDLAGTLNIPRLIFHCAGSFPTYVLSNIIPHLPISSSSPSLTIAGLPHKIQVHRDGLPSLLSDPLALRRLGLAEAGSFGSVVNTFQEMEPTYVDHYKAATNRVWCVGPVSLNNRVEIDLSDRVLSWLDARPAGSVVYVCFGSLCDLSGAQVREIAGGLEASGKPFIWVVRREEDEEAVTKGFGAPAQQEGLVVKGWAPQVAVLGHRAVGWFVTHCGWNSAMEAVCAGVPVVTWPLFHEQFINQELLVEVMGVGVRMWEGFRRQNDERSDTAIVAAEEVAEVLKRVCGGGEDVEAVTRRATEYAAAARKAVEEGGSSYNDTTALLDVLVAERGRRGSVVSGTTIN